MITRAQRKAIREAGPFRFGPYNTILDGNLFALWSYQSPLLDIDHAMLDALNAIVSRLEDEVSRLKQMLATALGLEMPK